MNETLKELDLLETNFSKIFTQAKRDILEKLIVLYKVILSVHLVNIQYT